MGKEFSKVIKSSKSLDDSYKIAKKAIELSNFNVKEDNKFSEGFELVAKEPMKWLSTNWPVTIEIKSDITNGEVYFHVCAKCGGFSITQDANTQEILKNFASTIETYCQ